MSLKKIKAEAEKQLFNNWTDTPIAWANVDFSTTPEVYIQCFTLPINEQRELVSSDEPFLTTAIFQINIKVKVNKGTAIHFEHENTLKTIFREKVLNGVSFRNVSSGAIFQDGEYQVLPVNISCDTWN